MLAENLSGNFSLSVMRVTRKCCDDCMKTRVCTNFAVPVHMSNLYSFSNRVQPYGGRGKDKGKRGSPFFMFRIYANES